MTTTDIINGILDREGEGKPPYFAKNDRGGRTSWGISERWHPDAWKNGPPTREVAFAIYEKEYVKPWEHVVYEPLKNQLIDCHVLHGLARTLIFIKDGLGLTTLLPKSVVSQIDVDHVIGMLNIAGYNIPCNNAIVAARLKFIDEITDADERQKVNEEGWESRALSFFVRVA